MSKAVQEHRCQAGSSGFYGQTPELFLPGHLRLPEVSWPGPGHKFRFDSVLIYSFFVRKELHPDLTPAFSYSGLKRAGINAGFQRPPIKFRPPRMLQIASTHIIRSLRAPFSIKNNNSSMIDWHCTFKEIHRKIHIEKRNRLINFIKTNYSINDDYFNLPVRR